MRGDGGEGSMHEEPTACLSFLDSPVKSFTSSIVSASVRTLRITCNQRTQIMDNILKKYYVGSPWKNSGIKL